jgi:phosphopantothenoylcysteine decarboxylase/phosphopantothenate--cysteine ligase
MLNETLKHFENSDITIMSAAVSDYKPKTKLSYKIKKQNDEPLSLDLVQNSDILKLLGNKKKKNQILIGFALETDNELQNANNKIKSKNLDAIVLNSLNDKGAGFGYDTNKVTYINNKGIVKNFKLKSKDEVSIDILDQLITDFHEKI